MNIKKIPVVAFPLLIILFLFTASAFSQNTPFGKNKVQYKEFKWRFIQTKHFDIYFHQDGKFLAEYAGHSAERSLADLTNNLEYRITNRVPIIIFNSHNEFQQNNVIDVYLPEGVGGVTELFKNRIVVPFEGDWEKFRHVIHHELLHAYMNDMFYGGSIQNIISRNITLFIPTWFNEGMAEIQSLYGLDKNTDMFIRDAVMNNYLPPVERLGGYFAYRGGQSFFAYLADTYGENKLAELMHNIRAYGDVDEGFYQTFKLRLRKLSDNWHKYLKKIYWPEIKTRVDVKDFARQLTDHTSDGGFYNVAPTISPKGDRFVFISNRDGRFDVFLANARTGQIIKKIIKGESSPDFEELHILTPGLSWAPDGRRIAISVKAGSSDAIFIIDVNSGNETKLPISFDGIFNVSWSPTGNKLAFVGNKAHLSNLYTFDLTTNRLETLTNDIFSESNPTWSPNGRFVYFTSDRGDNLNPNDIPDDFKIYNYDHSVSDIYRVNIDTKEIERVTYSEDSEDNFAQVSPDGSQILFVSDRNGIKNLYIKEIDSLGAEIVRPVTNSLNPIDQITVSQDGKRMMFVSLNQGGFDIFSLENPFDLRLDVSELEPTEIVLRRREFAAKFGMPYEGVDTIFIAEVDTNDREISDTLRIIDDQFTASDTLETEIDITEETNDTIKTYGEDVTVNLEGRRDTTSALARDTSYRTNRNFVVVNNLNPDGTFRIQDYKVKFTPDLVYGNATYSSFYGLQGVAQIALSDMLGNHRVYIQTSMVIDLKNSDYAVAYYHLPKRIDYGFELYHIARFVLFDRRDGFGENLFRYRTYGGTAIASYPFTRFKRVDGALTAMHISQENLDRDEEVRRKTVLIPSLSYIHDNTLWGFTSPVSGTRYNLTGMVSPKLGDGGLGFSTLTLDFRNYTKIADDYTFVQRLAGGASFGPNPQRFYIGGVDNWINRQFENQNIPISNIEEFMFSTPGIPLRGYNYDRLSGSKYGLLNLELRFPLLRYLIFGALPFGLQNIEGVAFIDAGTAWRDDSALKLFVRENGVLRTNDLLLGTGLGARTFLFNFPVRFDVAWGYNLHKFSKPKYYISLGYNF
jgi:Tol biopolymer transport system component